jgi:hypothetical protein
MSQNLFNTIFSNSKSSGKDDFPSCEVWESEINKWLLYIQNKNQLDRYKSRLVNVSKTMRDETLSEICAAYVMEMELKYKVVSWEEKTINDKDVDFVILHGSDKIYCEVKSPGWESELDQKERLSGRKNLPKNKDGEVHAIAPWEALRYAVKKSYPKLLSNCNNLIIVKDDLFVNILDTPNNIDIALFEEHGVYCNEKGYFTNKDFENVGGILILNCNLRSKIEYRYKFIANLNATNLFYLKAERIESGPP